MPPLDRYLKDVRAHLPGEQADDIVNELAENLRAQFEDREGDLGRPLTDAEQEAILKEHGNPLLVAARYRPEQASFSFGRQLIGPALFPAYTQVLTITFSVTLVLILVAALVVASGQPLDSFLSSIALAAVIQFAIITGIFVVADREMTVESAHAIAEVSTALRGIKPSLADRFADGLIGKRLTTEVPRGTSVGDLALVAITLAWMAFVRPPVVSDELRSGPGWEQYWLPIVVVLALSGVQPIVTFLRPRLVRFRSVARILTDVGLLGLFTMSLSTGQWVRLTNPATATAREASFVIEINRWVGISLGIAMAITALMAAFEVWRLVSRQRPEPAVIQAMR
jgi:hypothetical protein